MGEFTLTYTLERNLPVAASDAAARFTDPEWAPRWRPELLGRTQLAGEPYAPGSRAELLVAAGSRPMTQLEEVLDARLPELLRLRLTFQAYGGEMEHRFTDTDAGCRWTVTETWDLSQLELEEPPSDADRDRFQAATATAMGAFAASLS